MAKAIWNGMVLAESNQTQQVEGNTYFPPDSINKAYFRDSNRNTVCGWKGTASYYDIVNGDQVVPNAAWYYPDPKSAAKNITDHVAFYGMVKVEK